MSASFRMFDSIAFTPGEDISDLKSNIEKRLASAMPTLPAANAEFLVRQKLLSILPAGVANQLRLFTDISMDDLCAKANIILTPIQKAKSEQAASVDVQYSVTDQGLDDCMSTVKDVASEMPSVNAAHIRPEDKLDELFKRLSVMEESIKKLSEKQTTDEFE
ncbi:hypothetical protein RF11_00579 [Thelohanellus kitauei]|uniref:Uncharacterized protein n=1 Tax=Thelohanellus kitauei TaxID=669202 RepID=A0A0C2ND30_THEKT|nr:hypothetical protein RF11_00579 [Thelohanellus kitauei]